MSTCVSLELKGVVGCVSVTERDLLHPLVSVTRTLYVPILKLERFCELVLFDQEKVYGAVPPVTAKLIVPLEPPKQDMF